MDDRLFFQSLINGVVAAVELGRQIEGAVSNGVTGLDSSLLGVANQVVAIVEEVQESQLDEKVQEVVKEVVAIVEDVQERPLEEQVQKVANKFVDFVKEVQESQLEEKVQEVANQVVAIVGKVKESQFEEKVEKVANKVIAVAEEVKEIEWEDKDQEGGSESTVDVLCKMLAREMSKTVQLEEQLDKTQKKLLDLKEKIDYAKQNQSEGHESADTIIDNLRHLLAQEKERSEQLVNQLKEIRSNETRFQEKIQDLENELDASQTGQVRDKISQDHIDSLLKNKTKNEEEISRRKKTIADLRDHNRQLQCKIIHLEKKKAESDTEIDRLEKKIIQLEDEITCSVCTVVRVDSRINPCGHTLCAGCATQFKNQDENRNKCPFCRISFQSIDKLYFQ